MVLDFIETSVYVAVYLFIFIVTFYAMTSLNKLILSRKFGAKGIKLKCIKWKLFRKNIFSFEELLQHKFYTVEYIKKDGRVSKTRVTSKSII